MSPEEGKEVIIEYGKMKAENKKLERELSAAINGELSKYDELQEYVLELQSELMECQKENEKLNSITEEAMDIAESENCEVQRLEREKEKLRVKRNLFFERWKFKSEMYTELYEESDKYKLLLSEISQHIGNKPSSSTYKYFRAKLDGIGIKESE